MTADALSLSVVVPAYQMEDWLGECLRSIKEQSRPPEEIVVVDDGSTDATPRIAASTPGVKVVRQPNRGLAAARNAGTLATSTDWIFFLDADDVLRPGALESLRSASARYPHAAAINPGYESVLPDGRILQAVDRLERSFGRSDLWRVIRMNPFVANTLLRRDIAESYLYDETLRACEDLDLWFRLLCDDRAIVRLSGAHIRRAEERPGALTSHRLRMRQCRGTVFRRLWSGGRLSIAERAVLGYQLARVSAGIAVARRRLN